MTKSLACVLGLLLCVAATLSALEPQAAGGSWKFAISGDSRNCGDIIMPAIAQAVRSDGAEFYWHLGDYRRITGIDEDYHRIHPYAGMDAYLANAWPDFIDHQMKPFDDFPVFLGIGNHELVPPKTRLQYTAQFAEWLDKPLIRQQRLADDPGDHSFKTYYHWIQHGVDFITMDNASANMFDAKQMAWFESVLAKAAKDPSVRTVVVGLHEALPDSLSAGHSMNESAHEQSTGREVYSQLVAFRRRTKKNVYVLASHSHFVLSNVYETACHPKDEVLTGWIMGSAGAVRYRLPKEHAVAEVAMTDVYGYLLATVDPDGTVKFDFKRVKKPDIPPSVVKEFSQEQVNWCFASNISDYVPTGPNCR